MKNRLRQNLMVIVSAAVLTCIALLPVFRPGLYRSADLLFHLSRLDGIVQAVSDGQMPIAVYPGKNFGFGYASPLFYSDLFLIIPALVSAKVGIPLLTTFKIILFIFVFITAFSMIYIIRKRSSSTAAGILAAVILLFSNYYQTDLFVRGALGEIMALAFLPSVLNEIYSFLFERKDNWLRLALLYCAVINSHIISFLFDVLIFAALLAVFGQKWIRERKMRMTLFKAVSAGFLLSCVFLLPFLQQYTAQDLCVGHMDPNLMSRSTVPFGHLFDDICMQFSFRWGNTEGLKEMDLYKNAGVLVLLVIPVYLIFTDRKNHWLNALAGISVFCLLCSLGVIPLQMSHRFDFIQFPSRFYMPLIVVCAFLAGYVFTHMNRKLQYTAGAVILLYSLWNVSYLFAAVTKGSDILIIDERSQAKAMFEDWIYAGEGAYPEYSTHNWEEVHGGEYLPWTNDFNYSWYPKAPIIAAEEYVIEDFTRNGTEFIFSVDRSESMQIVMPLSWYPGYTCYEIDENCSRITQIPVGAQQYTQLVYFSSLPGRHTYRVHYDGTTVQKASLWISVLTALFLMGYEIINRIRIKKKKA